MQHVANDYAMRLAWGRADASSFMGPALAALTKAPAGASFLLCDLANVTICPPLESTAATVLVAIYNSQVSSGGCIRPPAITRCAAVGEFVSVRVVFGAHGRGRRRSLLHTSARIFTMSVFIY